VYETDDVDFLMRYYVVSEWSGEIERFEAEELYWRPITVKAVDIEPDKAAVRRI